MFTPPPLPRVFPNLTGFFRPAAIKRFVPSLLQKLGDQTRAQDNLLCTFQPMPNFGSGTPLSIPRAGDLSTSWRKPIQLPGRPGYRHLLLEPGFDPVSGSQFLSTRHRDQVPSRLTRAFLDRHRRLSETHCKVLSASLLRSLEKPVINQAVWFLHELKHTILFCIRAWNFQHLTNNSVSTRHSTNSSETFRIPYKFGK